MNKLLLLCNNIINKYFKFTTENKERILKLGKIKMEKQEN